VVISVALSLNPFYYKGRIKLDRRRGQESMNLQFAGRTESPGFSKDKPPFSDYTSLVTACPKLAEYKLPSHSYHDEKFVLEELYGKLRDETAEGIHYLNAAQEVIDYLTPKSLQPCWFRDGIVKFEDIIDVINTYDRTKHPGYPACLLSRTKGGIIENHLVDLVHAVGARIICLDLVGPSCVTPEDYYNTFCSDFSCFSIKNEPVKTSKFGRGLNATSIVTSCVERLVHNEFNVAFKEHCFENYSAIGMGFTREDSEILMSTCKLPIMVSDVPSMDATVTLHEGLMNCRSSLKSMGCRNPRVERIALSLETGHFNKVFILSNGRTFVQTKSGGQCTGRDETSNFNTKTRARRAYAVNVWLMSRGYKVDPMVMGAGDDCLEGSHPRKEEIYNMLGFPLRDAEETNDVEFCSHKWPIGKVPYGTRLYKAGFSLLLHEPLPPEPVMGFIREFGGHSEFPALFQIISEHRPEMKLIIIEMLDQIRQKEREVRKYTACSMKYLECANKQSKKKKEQTKAKKPKPKSPAPRRTSEAPLKQGSLAMQVCSVSNPFCPEAKGARWPDNSYTKSVGWSYNATNTLFTLAAGDISGLFFAGLANFASPTGITTGTCAYGGATTLPPIPTGVGRWRLTSWGVKLTTPLSALTASGTVSVRMFSPMNGASLTSISGMSSAADFALDIPLARLSSKDLYLVPMPLGNEARMFRDNTLPATVAVWENPGWQVIHVYVSGAPAATVVCNYTVYYNYEFIFFDGDSGNQFSIAPPKDNPPVRFVNGSVLNDVGNFFEGAASTLDSIYQSKAFKYIKGAGELALTLV